MENTSTIYELKPRSKVFNESLENEIINGNKVLAKNESEFTAIILQKAPPVNHVLHGILTLFTLVWGIAWLIATVMQEQDKRFRLVVNEDCVVVKYQVN
jgi:hypothetical protein